MQTNKKYVYKCFFIKNKSTIEKKKKNSFLVHFPRRESIFYHLRFVRLAKINFSLEILIIFTSGAQLLLWSIKHRAYQQNTEIFLCSSVKNILTIGYIIHKMRLFLQPRLYRKCFKTFANSIMSLPAQFDSSPGSCCSCEEENSASLSSSQ